MKIFDSFGCAVILALAICCAGCEPVTSATSNSPSISDGSSSDQIGKLSAELQELSTQLNELKQRNETLQTRLSQSEENYNHLLGKYTTLVDDIKNASDTAIASFDQLRNITENAAKVIRDSTVSEDPTASDEDAEQNDPTAIAVKEPLDNDEGKPALQQNRKQNN